MDVNSTNNVTRSAHLPLSNGNSLPVSKVLSNDHVQEDTSMPDLKIDGADDSTDQEKNDLLPHDIKRRHDDPIRWLMSWWPEPDMFTMRDDDDKNIRPESNEKHQSTKARRPSVLKRIRHSFDHLTHGQHRHPAEAETSTKNADPTNDEATSITPEPTKTPKNELGLLYHVVLTSSHFHKDVNSTVQAVRICGTYTSLQAATMFAHRCLFDAGYEVEWFTSFIASKSGDRKVPEDDTIVTATGPDAELFTVSIKTDANRFAMQAGVAQRIETPLYHVVQTVVHYREDESGETRETSVKASFPSYRDARSYALTSVLVGEDRPEKEDFDVYDEAQPGDLDCGYGENVIVHAVGKDGNNFLVSILKGHEMESVRLMEAAMRMRG